MPWSGLVVVPWVLAFSMSPNVLRLLLKRGPANAGLYCFVLRGDVGRGRADLGPDDPLPGCRPGPGHRVRPLRRGGTLDPAALQGRDSASLCGTPRAKPRCWASLVASAGHRHGRHGRHVQREGTARRGEEEGRRGIRLQEGHVGGHLFGRHERGHGLWAARRGALEERAQSTRRHLPHLEGHPGAGGRAAGRLHGQPPLVSLPESQEQDHRATTPAKTRRWRPTSIFAGLAGLIWCLQFITSRSPTRRWASLVSPAGRCSCPA